MSDVPIELLEKTVINCAPVDVRMRVETLQSSSKTDDSPGVKLVQLYAASASGERYYDELLQSEGINRTVHRTFYSDGVKSASVSYDKQNHLAMQQVTILRSFGREQTFGFAEAPPPVRYYFVGLLPLSEALPSAESMGAATVIGRDCLVFHFKNVGPSNKPQSLAYFLDVQTGLPLRVSAYDNPARLRQQIPNWEWEATSLEQVAGHPIASTSTLSAYRSFKVGENQSEHRLDLFQAIRVVKAEFDVSLPKTTFWPTYQPGVRVSDRIANRTFIVPGGPQERATKTETGEPIRVPVPHDRESGILSAAGVLISLAILVAAVLLWRRSS